MNFFLSDSIYPRLALQPPHVSNNLVYVLFVEALNFGHVAESPMMSDDTSLNGQVKALISMMAGMVNPVKKRWAFLCPAASLTVTRGTIRIKEFFAS